MTTQDTDNLAPRRQCSDPDPVDDPYTAHTLFQIRERLQAFFLDGHVLDGIACEPVKRGSTTREID